VVIGGRGWRGFDTWVSFSSGYLALEASATNSEEEIKSVLDTFSHSFRLFVQGGRRFVKQCDADWLLL
jgi:hypothetical protein